MESFIKRLTDRINRMPGVFLFTPEMPIVTTGLSEIEALRKLNPMVM